VIYAALVGGLHHQYVPTSKPEGDRALSLTLEFLEDTSRSATLGSQF
jgi:hypothetical protein